MLHLKCLKRAPAMDANRGNCQPDHSSIGRYTSTSTTALASPKTLITRATILTHLWYTNGWIWRNTLILPCTIPIPLFLFRLLHSPESPVDVLDWESTSDKTTSFSHLKPTWDPSPKMWQRVPKSTCWGGLIARTALKKPQSLYPGIESSSSTIYRLEFGISRVPAVTTNDDDDDNPFDGGLWGKRYRKLVGPNEVEKTLWCSAMYPTDVIWSRLSWLSSLVIRPTLCLSPSRQRCKATRVFPTYAYSYSIIINIII